MSDFRDVLEDINKTFGTGAWITISEIASYDGSDKRTVRKRYQIPAGVSGMNRVLLAKKIVALATK